MSYSKVIIGLSLFFILNVDQTFPQGNPSRFQVIVLAEKASIHRPFVDAAMVWLNQLASDSSFSINYIETTDSINEKFLSRYQLFIQLDYPPYGWTDKAAKSFQKYIEEGEGGWLGFHHATLLGEFDGFAMWTWFSKFMGDIRFKNYIAGFAAATVNLEDIAHPCLKNVPPSFLVLKDEWYTYDKTPRPNVHVLASVNESTYKPSTEIKMGDHPVVWTNEKVKARNIYIFMGHHPDLFLNDAYKILLRNSIMWTAGKIK